MNGHGLLNPGLSPFGDVMVISAAEAVPKKPPKKPPPLVVEERHKKTHQHHASAEARDRCSRRRAEGAGTGAAAAAAAAAAGGGGKGANLAMVIPRKKLNELLTRHTLSPAQRSSPSLDGDLQVSAVLSQGRRVVVVAVEGAGGAKEEAKGR